MAKPTYLYRFFDRKNTLLYIGISRNPTSRIASHEYHSTWFHRTTTITLKKFLSKSAALIAEEIAIEKEKPLYAKSPAFKRKELEKINSEVLKSMNTLSRYMKKNNITQKRMGDLIGVSQAIVSKYLHNNSIPRLEIMKKIEEVTNSQVTAQDFYG